MFRSLVRATTLADTPNSLISQKVSSCPDTQNPKHWITSGDSTKLQSTDYTLRNPKKPGNTHYARPKGSMYPNSIYLSLKVVSVLVLLELWGQSIYYLGTWILWEWDLSRKRFKVSNS